jgi:hypothetical protein
MFCLFWEQKKTCGLFLSSNRYVTTNLWDVC